MRARAMCFVRGVPCPECHGSRIRPEALTAPSQVARSPRADVMPLAEVAKLLRPVADLPEATATTPTARSGEPARAAVRICADLVARIDVLLGLGPDDLGLGRRSTALSPGEAQRPRIAASCALRAVRHGPCARRALRRPAPGGHGATAGRARPAQGVGQLALRRRARSRRRAPGRRGGRHRPRFPRGRLRLTGVSRHHLREVSVDVPLRVLTAVTGVSGSGKPILVTQVLAEVVGRHPWPGRSRRGTAGAHGRRCPRHPSPPPRRMTGTPALRAGTPRRRVTESDPAVRDRERRDRSPCPARGKHTGGELMPPAFAPARPGSSSQAGERCEP